MTDLISLPPLLDEDLSRLSTRYRKARGPGMQLLTMIGGQAEGLLDRLPKPAREGLEGATERALSAAFDLASQSHGRVPSGPDWLKRAVTMGTGAAGGFGGVPSSLAELPVTVTILLRSIQDIARQYDVDPDTSQGRAACLQVFAAAGPLSEDDGTDTGLIATRLTVTGATVHGLIARVAPQLSVALGQKLAVQAVPLLGAAAGAATNYVFTSYYQEMAHVQFGLIALSRDHGVPMQDLLAAFEAQTTTRRIR